MAKVSLPDRGQPLDLAYIYQLAEAINNLSNQLSPVTAKYTTIDTVTSGKQSVRTSDARIIGGYVSVTNNASTTAGTEVSFSYTFSDFAYAPIITATPITANTDNTDASKDVIVTLTRITTGRVDGIVKFNTIGVSSIGLNLIIIGIPV